MVMINSISYDTIMPLIYDNSFCENNFLKFANFTADQNYAIHGTGTPIKSN